MNKRIAVSFLFFLIFAIGGIVAFDKKDFIANADIMIVPDSVCGDGYAGFKMGLAEECDDGNLNDNDGCSSLCKVEDIEPEVPVCSDNTDNDGDGFVDGKDAGCHTDWNADNPGSYDPSWVGEYEIKRVSLASDGTEGNSDSYSSSISSDGRFVTFNSFARNLVLGDSNNTGDVFIRDRFLGETRRASISSIGIEGNGDSFSSSVSADGRFVAFVSYAKNLVLGDNNGTSDIFVHDFLTGETRRVSFAFDGAEVNDSCHNASISSDGRYVRFYSHATNLVAGHGGNWYDRDAFIYDYQTNRVESAPEVPNGAQRSTLYFSSFSADGRFTVFSSPVEDLIGDDTFQHHDVIFIYDSLEANTARVNI